MNKNGAFRMRFTQILMVVASVTALTACSSNSEFHFWQKRDPSSALYLTGVKAQQMLEQDIATCVHEVIEMTKLADVRDNLSESMTALGSYDQKQATDGMNGLPRWDVPEYIRNLRVDHTDFHDFDGCMNYKGWQRVKYVAPNTERRAREIYDATGDYSVRPKRPVQERYERETAMGSANPTTTGDYNDPLNKH